MDTTTALLQLQELDLELHRSILALKQIPEAGQINEVRSRLKELARRSTRITGLLKDKQMERAEAQERRSTLAARIEELRQSNGQVDFRRASANNAEIDRIAKAVEKIDFTDQQFQSEIEELETLKAKAAQAKRALEQKEHQLLLAFRDKALDLRTSCERLQAKRDGLIHDLDPVLLERYKKSCAAHAGVGVSRLDHSSCTGCGVELQPAQVDDLRSGDDLGSCPMCGRLMVVREPMN